MKQLAFLLSVAALMLIIAGCTTVHSAAPTPFTAVTAHFMELPGAAPRLAMTVTAGVRSGGSHFRVTQHHANQGVPEYVKREVTFADGLRSVIWETTRTKTTYRSEFKPIGPDPAKSCVAFTDGSPFRGITTHSWDKAQGYDAIKASVEGRNSPERHLTIWMAPELHCFTVQQEFSENGVPAKSGMKLLSVTKGEPPSEYFSVPEGFQEVAPSIAELRIYDWMKQHNPLCCRKEFDSARLAPADEKYVANRP